jgi:hypothetical protein
MSVWPVEGSRYGVDGTYHGATGFERAVLNGSAARRTSRVRRDSSRSRRLGRDTGRSDGFLWLETRQVEAARDNPHFFLYVVENVRQGDPQKLRLIIFSEAQLQRLLARAREKHYYEVPIPVAEYDLARTTADSASVDERLAVPPGPTNS